jgi:hypothetical protein
MKTKESDLEMLQKLWVSTQVAEHLRSGSNCDGSNCELAGTLHQEYWDAVNRYEEALRQFLADHY